MACYIVICTDFYFILFYFILFYSTVFVLKYILPFPYWLIGWLIKRTVPVHVVSFVWLGKERHAMLKSLKKLTGNLKQAVYSTVNIIVIK